MTDRPRLIEVAFPLKRASIDSAHEKNLRHGHISTLDIWPARRPPAAGRAALIPTVLPELGNAAGWVNEVKGRARVGDIEMKEYEWTKACNLRDRYWLYVVYDCATANPRLLRVHDPSTKLIVKARGGGLVNPETLADAAQTTTLQRGR
jgi:hypothetical protein